MRSCVALIVLGALLLGSAAWLVSGAEADSHTYKKPKDTGSKSKDSAPKDTGSKSKDSAPKDTGSKSKDSAPKDTGSKSKDSVDTSTATPKGKINVGDSKALEQLKEIDKTKKWPQ